MARTIPMTLAAKNSHSVDGRRVIEGEMACLPESDLLSS